MLRGLYTAASGMLAQTVATDTLANNLANVSTVGYKNNKVNFQAFPEMLISRMSNQGQQDVGSIMTGSGVRSSVVDFSTGTLRATGNPLDLAMEGDAFFTVRDQKTNETYYTKAGNFTADTQGFLTTLNGDRVQGLNGDIALNLQDGEITISKQGQVATKGGAIDRLKVAHFPNNNVLEKVGDTKFRAVDTQGMNAKAETGFQVLQGTVELSNTNPIGELINNIQGLRLYEALQKNIKVSNDTLQKAVNDVGRYRG